MAARLCVAVALAFVLGFWLGCSQSTGQWKVRAAAPAPPILSANVSSDANGSIVKAEAPSNVPGPSDDWDREEVLAHLATYDFEEIWPQLSLWTMIGSVKARFAWDAVLKVNAMGLEGDIVEAGVWKGGATMAMVLANMKHNTDRHFWLFDTFEGLPPPGKKDDKRSHKLWKQLTTGTGTYASKSKGQKIRVVESGKLNYGPKAVVSNNLFWTGYPWENFHFIKGKVEDTLPRHELPPKIAILRLDTDWYASTKVELEYLWSRLVPGGLLYIDDYCSWGGAREATKEFFAKVLHLNSEKLSKVKPCFFYWKPK